MADHVIQTDWRALVTRLPVRGKTHGGNRAGIDHATNAGLLGGPQDQTRAFDICPVHGLGIEYPEAIIRRYVENQLATCHAASQRLDIRQIAGPDTCLEGSDFL